MADIYTFIFILYIFLFVQVLYSEYHRAAAHNSVRLIGLFRKGHNCAQSCVGASRRSYYRAGKPRTATWEYCPGNVSYFNRIWPPHLLGKSTEYYHRPISTIGRRWDSQGLPLWDFIEQ